MSMPEMHPVTSKSVSTLGYDEAAQEAYIQFHSGGLYVYRGVPAHEYENLLNAQSVGSYHHTYFKNVYPYERIG